MTVWTMEPPPAPAEDGEVRHPAGDREVARPRWMLPGLIVLLIGTGLLYLWGLSASGWANSFYSAAAQAGSQSWKALFFGSSDAANSITVDKTPASLWVMALPVRIFGLNSWSILVPQALAGVASVGVLFAAVRRWAGPAAGLVAGAILALTPVAVLMFRFNNPDALLVLLLVAAGYATVRAVEAASTRWLVLAGALVGFGFLTKMLQAFLVVPALLAVYLLAAPTGLGRRIRQVLLAGLALLLAAGWWVAIVELIPARYRPYIGGSQHNSVLELTFGYNGLGRLSGNETGSVGGGMGWGRTGWTRMFGTEVGGQVSWLLPAALILLVAGLLVVRRAPRTDRTRAGLVLWGGWLLVTGLVFSFMAGIFHAYYTVALAPAIGGVVAIGAAALWRERGSLLARGALALAVAATAVWSYVLLARTPDWYPALRVLILVAGLGAAAALAVTGRGMVGRVALGVATVAALAGPAAYAVQTAATAHTGAIPTAGPAVAGGFGSPGGRGGLGGGFRGGFGPPPGALGSGTPGGAFPGFPGGTAGTGGTGNGATGGTRTGMPGGMGGLLDARTPSSELVAALKADAGRYTWIAASVGANNAAGYQLATGEPVMPIGGFNGSDPSPTLAQFQRYVRDGKIHYFIGGGGFGGPGGQSGGTSSQIASWVAANYAATTVGGVTLYDLTAPTS